MNEAPETDIDDQSDPVTFWQVIKADRKLQVVMLVLALAFGFFLRGVTLGVTGEDRISLPPSIQSIDPSSDAVQVPSKSRIFVDLADDYTGVLIIDEIELETVNIGALRDDAAETPGSQVAVPPVTIYEPGNDTLMFTPSSGAAIEEFTEGDHNIELIYWKVTESRDFSARYIWTITVV